MKKRTSILLAALLLSFLAGIEGAYSVDAGSWTELTGAIQQATSPINITGNITGDGLTGLGTLGGDVTINGGGYDINGGKQGGITVSAGQTLTINNVGIPSDENSLGFNGFVTNGNGGAIFNMEGTVDIINSSFANNSAEQGNGGAIFNMEGTVDITNSSFTGNSAEYGGGAIFNTGATMTITDSTFSNNSAYDEGGAIFNMEGTMTITDSSFTGNSAEQGIGGAILNSETTMTITDSSFANNSAAHSGTIANFGTMTIKDSSFTGNSAEQGNSGAIYNETTMTITDSSFTGNSAEQGNGGAIFSYGTADITNSSFANNSAAHSGAIANYGTMTITDSSFTDNSAVVEDGLGGAIFNNGTLNIIADKSDTVFTGNTAGGVSNALYNKHTTNLNAGGHKVIFNDGINGSEYNVDYNIININAGKDVTGIDAPTTGVVEFNNLVSDNTINLYGGTLKLGQYAGGEVNGKTVAASRGDFSSNVVLNLYGGILDTIDNEVRNYTIDTLGGDGGALALDISFADSGTTADSFTIDRGDANVNIVYMNIAGDIPQAGQGTVQIIKGATNNISLKNYGVFTKDINIDFTQNASDNGTYDYTVGTNGGLKAAVDFDGNRQYEMLEDETITQDLGTMNGDKSTLTINGYGHNINGDGHSGIYVNKGQTLYVNNVGNPSDENSLGFNGFVSNNNGGAISNTGTMTITDSTFSNNSAEYRGGAIANYGTMTITGSSFSDNSTGEKGYGGAIFNYGTTTITDSTFTNNSGLAGGAIFNTDGTTTIVDSTFTGNNSKLVGGAINSQIGTLNIIADKSDTVFTGNTAGGVSNALHNLSNTTNLNAGKHCVIFNDGIDSVEEYSDYSIININAGKDVTGIDAPTSGTIEFNNEVKYNTVNMYNGTLKFGTNSQNGINYAGTLADSVNFNYNGGAVSLQNNSINSANLGNLTLNNDMDLKLDANFADKTIDTITTTSFNPNGHNINISNLFITKPTTDKSFSLSPIGTGMDDASRNALAGAVQYTGGDVIYSPIYKYSASYDPDTALLNFGLYGTGGGESGGGSSGTGGGTTPGYQSFNPAVMASPVAAQLGGYLVQLNSYDNAFRNMDMYMLLTKEQRQAMKMRNRFAAASKNIVFDPTVTQYENKAGWFRPYATFENVPLNNGPDVSNVAYGSFFGAESELYDLGHGWDGMWGIYAGYNGSHQTFDHVSIWQNGGTLGAVGMAYKGNFFTGLTANIGASVGEANAMFGHEDFTMLMSGIASKTGYNFEFAKGKFIIQPSLLMSYSFINTFDYHNAAGVSINSDPLHAIQLEPGLKFIGNLKNGWQPYLGVSVVWNIMDRTQFQANNVALPNLSVDPFVKYGVGVRKSWGEKFTGFFQTYITNGGRNGVGLQAGFRWLLGKSDSKKQKAKVTLKSMSMK